MTAATETFDNVNFQILLKQHGGNVQRALAAWRAICQLGKFGDVNPNYDGGLDLKSLRTMRDEADHGGNDSYFGITTNRHGFARQKPADVATTDDLKRLEDIAAGDEPLMN